jgi:hypothetical protein
MDVEIGAETLIFLFWEYLFPKIRYFVFAEHCDTILLIKVYYILSLHTNLQILLTTLYYIIPLHTPLLLNVLIPSLIFYTPFHLIIYLFLSNNSLLLHTIPFLFLPLYSTPSVYVLYHPFSIAHFALLSHAFKKLTLSVILSLSSHPCTISFHTHCKSFVQKLDLMFVLILFVNTVHKDSGKYSAHHPFTVKKALNF